MLFFPFMFFNVSFLINMAAAVLPALYLMNYVYKKDTIEKEPRGLLVSLVFCGAASGIASIILETVGSNLLNSTQISPDSSLYAILMAFLVVALVEEGTKYIFLKLRTWKHPAFNYRFDGVVYAVFVSLGFAAFENILYVSQYGLSVALPRAFLSIPGHMSFAVVMGIFYGRAKLSERLGDPQGARTNRLTGYVAAVFLHGFYDACLMVGSGFSTILFVAYVILMYVFIFRLIKSEASTDEPV